MKNTQNSESSQSFEEDLLSEYDFDYSKARPNRFAAQLNETTITVTLESDVAKVFQTSEMYDARAIQRAWRPQQYGLEPVAECSR